MVVTYYIKLFCTGAYRRNGNVSSPFSRRDKNNVRITFFQNTNELHRLNQNKQRESSINSLMKFTDEEDGPEGSTKYASLSL